MAPFTPRIGILINSRMKVRNISKIRLLGLILFISISAFAQNGKDADKPADKPAKQPDKIGAGPVKLQRPTGFLNDLSGIFSESEKDETERVLRELREKAEIDLGIAVIDTTGGKDISGYSLEMAREWKIGAKNGGALLVVAIKDRGWYIQIDSRLQKDLSNEEIRNIGEVMIPDFREGKYPDGIKKCVEKIISVLAAKQHFAPIKFKTDDIKKQ